MKKLMTMLAAVGMAFGLFADEPITPIGSTSFEAVGEFDGDNLVTNETPWTCTDPDAKLTKGVYDDDAYVYPAERPRYSAFTGDNETYLNVKTAFGKPLVRAAAATVDDTAVFYDQLVKFTAADTDTDFAIDGGAKIAFFVVDESEAEPPVAETNLYVVSGKYVNNVLSVVTNKFAGIDVNEWHRLTIKSMKGYAQDDLAFEVFLDGTALELSAPAIDDASAAGMTDTAKAVNKAKKLFPSMVASSLQIAGIELSGTGAIDDVIATRESPEWAVDKYVTLGWGDHVTGFTYTIGSDATPVSGLTGAGTIQIVYGGNFDVTLSGLSFDTDWGFDTVDTDGCGYNDNYVISYTGEGQSATILAKDATPRVTVTIDEETKSYPTLAAAFAALPNSGTASIALAQDLTDDCGIGDDGDGYTEAGITTAAEVTLDLAGKTIGLKTGASITEGALIETAAATLTITDTVGGGKIDATGVDMGAVGIYTDAKLIVEGEEEFFIDGDVVYDNGMTEDDISISAGSFKSDDDQDFYLNDFLADGFEAAYAEGYWTVSAMTPATVDLALSHATVVGVEDEAEVYEGDVIEFTAAPVQYYTNVVVTIKGQTITPVADTYSYTVKAEDIGNTIAINVSASPIAWTISYREGEEGDYTEVSNETYTIESRLTQALWDGTREGYTKDGNWQDAEGNDVEDVETYLADKTGPVELYCTWIEEAKDVTITLPDVQDVPGVTAITAYQSDDDGGTWTEVDDGKIVVGNLWKVEATAAEGYEVQNPIASGTAAEGVGIEITTNDFEGKVVPAEKDPTEDDPTLIDPTETAATRYGDKVPATLANVSAKSICVWAKGNGDLKSGDAILENAFLLNCENTEAAINAAKANFKATSITINSDGKVDVGMPEGTYNGTIEKWGKEELDDLEWTKDLDGAKFFELKLVPTNLN